MSENSYVLLGKISGNTKFDGEKLSKLFLDRVLGDPNMVWYVDYWTYSAERFNVNFFADCPRLHWTNENIIQRTQDGSHWSSDDVSEWFISRGLEAPKGGYSHTFEFEAGHTVDLSTHVIKLEPWGVTINGRKDSAAWDRYIETGIRGAFRGFRVNRLLSLTVEHDCDKPGSSFRGLNR